MLGSVTCELGLHVTGERGDAAEGIGAGRDVARRIVVSGGRPSQRIGR